MPCMQELKNLAAEIDDNNQRLAQTLIGMLMQQLCDLQNHATVLRESISNVTQPGISKDGVRLAMQGNDTAQLDHATFEIAAIRRRIAGINSMIAAGEFDFSCRHCHKPIGILRLLAEPLATLCVPCKKHNEEFHKKAA